MNNKNEEKMLEQALFEPIKNYLQQSGYQVHAEVKKCDIVAEKNGEIIIIELKNNISIQLLLQAIDRQKATDFVYIAFPKKKITYRQKKKLLHLLRRLELGAIEVNLDVKEEINVWVEPQTFQRKRLKKRKNSILKEITTRKKNYNVAGISQKKIVTAYRMNVLKIAGFLLLHDTMTTKSLRELGCGTKTTAILNSNFYKWFDRVNRGTYQLTPRGLKDLPQFLPVLIDIFPENLSEMNKKLGIKNEHV